MVCTTDITTTHVRYCTGACDGMQVHKQGKWTEISICTLFNVRDMHLLSGKETGCFLSIQA